MTYPLFEVPADADYETRNRPGAFWFVTPYGPDGDKRDYFLQHLASEEYKRDWSDKRPPICVCLPDRSWWPIDQQFSGVGGQGWVITGEAPKLTAHPSIHAVGSYHGWLRDGVLTDDIDGKTYPADETTGEMEVSE